MIIFHAHRLEQNKECEIRR